MSNDLDITWKDVTNARKLIFGISALWIVFFHINLEVEENMPTCMAMLISRGNMGVDVFLFLSAFGLSFSYAKNTLKEFYWHRIKRVAIPFLWVSIPYFLWYDFFYLKDGFLQFLLNVSTINNWFVDDYAIWYVAAIIPLYLIYPSVYIFNQKTEYISTLFIIVVSVVAELWIFQEKIYYGVERVWSRVPVFIGGLLLSNWLKEQSNNAVKIQWYFILVCLALLFVIFIPAKPIMMVRYLYGIAVVPFLILTTFLFDACLNYIKWFKALYKFCEWIGELSLEVYIIHVIIIRLIHYYDYFNLLPSLLWYVLIPIATLPLAYGLQTLNNKIVSILSKE